jgi:hypothetical protein
LSAPSKRVELSVVGQKKRGACDFRQESLSIAHHSPARFLRLFKMRAISQNYIWIFHARNEASRA